MTVEVTLNHHIYQIAEKYFTDRQPLGPIQAPARMDREFFDLLFETENRIISELNREAQLFVGRRGSGKTSFLKSVQFLDNKALVVEITSVDAFSMIANAIEAAKDRKEVIFVEQVARVWITIYWLGMLWQVGKEVGNAGRANVSAALEQFGYRRRNRTYDLVMKLLSALDMKFSTSGTVELSVKGEKIAEAISSISDIGTDLDGVILSIKNYLVAQNRNAYILIDSLEDYKLNNDSIQLALQGFLKSINHFTEPGERYSARACIPAELYHVFRGISSNPTKDFDLQQILHWHAGELLQICAARYSHYLRVKEPDLFARKYSQYNLSERGQVVEFWRNSLPEFVINGFQLKEDPLAYILHHTQLLPRQLIQYFNSIIALNHRKFRNRRDSICQEAIVQGVQEVEGTMCREIFSAYRHVHPLAQSTVAKSLPYLKYEFSGGELHKVFNRHAKAAFEGGDFEDFRRMMIEVGVVGRVEKHTERYVVGKFDYTVPNQLVVTTEDNLCLHPLFVRTHRARIKDSDNPVYPHGTEFDKIDYRDDM
ncbi:MAG: P-loop ATPase, Sll1717 family [Aestuariivirga sp.]